MAKMRYRPTVRTAMTNNGIPVVLYILGAILLIAISNNNNTTFVILFASGLLLLPGPVILHINYWTLDKDLILDVSEGIQIINEKTKKRIRFALNDILEIQTVGTSSVGAPWNMNEYIIIKLQRGDHITLTNYIIDGITLVELLKSKNLRVRKQRFLPIVEHHILSDVDRAIRTTKCIPNSAQS